jgi:hypothetical protein
MLSQCRLQVESTVTIYTSYRAIGIVPGSSNECTLSLVEKDIEHTSYRNTYVVL